MAKKFVCDRCGTDTLQGFTITIPPKKEIDLCENCRDQFIAFLKGETHDNNNS